MPHFVVLEHDSPRGLHWDFMLESGGALLTWELPRPPDAAPLIPAKRLHDHRLAYLEYEGPLSDGRGCVTRWDQGTYTIQTHSHNTWAVELSGGKLSAIYRPDEFPLPPAGVWLLRLNPVGTEIENVFTPTTGSGL